LASCRQNENKIVSTAFADSLIGHYSISPAAIAADSNLAFWKRRMDHDPDNFVNGPEYASALNACFRLHGNIHDLLKCDSLYKCSDKANQEKEPGIFRTLASLAMTQHQFQQAENFLEKAIQIEGNSVPNIFMDFDVSFELGKYARAKYLLSLLQKERSYGYLFRRSKLEHYYGSLDTAIGYMLKASQKTNNNNNLKQVSLSNAADLCIHKGKLDEAYKLYVESIKTDASDLHSIMGIGWIALVHDKNFSLARRIFQLVQKNTQSPDIILKLEQAAEANGDQMLAEKYANDFTTIANDSVYGGMYRKYLIELYTGILHQPVKALELAEKEINNRPTPQTFAWYCWSLVCNHKTEQAYQIYKRYISGKPLEGLELYYMGKLMLRLNKGYNAQQFFEAAHKNRYDLGPEKQIDLEENLN
jgi:Tfp pilus assembly protein PilF